MTDAILGHWKYSSYNHLANSTIISVHLKNHCIAMILRSPDNSPTLLISRETLTYLVVNFSTRIDVFLNCISEISPGSSITSRDFLDLPELSSRLLKKKK